MRSAQDGFVLAFVVFMLFAISVAGATGYMIVSSEFSMSTHAGEGSEALAVARAGLERFVAEHVGAVPDTTTYAMGDGVVVVTTRKILEQDSVTHFYYIKAEATVTDIRTPNTPARRVVGAQAILRKRPLPHMAALITSATNLTVHPTGAAVGVDLDLPITCAGGGATPIAGAVANSTVLGTTVGVPLFEVWPGGWSAVRDSIRVRWDVLSDPDFPVDYENTLPALGSIPADSFPIVRYTGGTTILSTSGWHNRGVLIVTGTLRPWFLFDWDGIVLAGNIGSTFISFLGGGAVDGMMIGGLDADNAPSSLTVRTDVLYRSCQVYGANESLSYFELLPNTMYEAN